MPGEARKMARWCARCPSKPAGAVDLAKKRCECGASWPSLGLVGDSRRDARWCAKCPDKPLTAVNVAHKVCTERLAVMDAVGQTTPAVTFTCLKLAEPASNLGRYRLSMCIYSLAVCDW